MGRRPDRGRYYVYELAGTISHAGFSSGHRFVVGHWDRTPIGAMVDVMWARPDGVRVLLVDRPEAARFITAVYEFDVVEVVEFSCVADGDWLRVDAGDVHLTMRAGRPWRMPFAGLRRRALIRPLERLVAGVVFGVRTVGDSPTGVREWYRADQYRQVLTAEASLAGVGLGTLCGFHEPARFGFSEPPRSPAVVRVQPRLEDRSGRVTAALAGPER